MGYNLPPRARRTMAALIEVIMPRGGPFDLEVQDEMMSYVEEMLPYLPPLIRSAFPYGLLLLEYGTLPLAAKARSFSKLPLDQRERYIEGWMESRLFLRREMIKGIKALAVLAYFEHPEVKRRLGFMPPEYVEEVGEKRLEHYGKAIERIQKATS
jgi:hypothetical protein